MNAYKQFTTAESKQWQNTEEGKKRQDGAVVKFKNTI